MPGSRERGGGRERPLLEKERPQEVFIDEPQLENTSLVPVERKFVPPEKLSPQRLKEVALFEDPAAQVDIFATPGVVRERVNVPSETDVLDATEVAEDNFADVDYQPSFFNRLAKNPWARRALRMLGVAGAVGGMKQGVEAYQEVERQSEIQKEIVSIAYESSFEAEEDAELELNYQIEPEHVTVLFDDGTTATGKEILSTVNENMTKWALDSYKGLLGITDDGIAEVTLADGSEGVDVLRLEWAYGDQLKSYHMDSPERVELLRQATGLNEAEFDTIGKIYRDSVIERPDASASGLLGLQYHDSDRFNAIDATPEHSSEVTNHARLEDALKITTEIVRSLNVEDMAQGEREQLVKVVKEAIKETIEADNTWTRAAGYTSHWGEVSYQTGFTQSVENKIDNIEAEKPMLEQLLEADQDVDLAWRKVAALEHDENGPVHAIADAITGSLESKGEAFFKKALELDPNAEAFKTGLEHFSVTGTGEIASN